MTLRTKTFLTIGILLFCSVIAMYVVSSIILLNGFAQEEERDTRQNIQRVQDALSNELETLSNTARDYASWDDTYAFIQDANSDYIASNLIDATFVNLQLNVMAFVHSSGKIVHAQAFDLKEEQAAAWPDDLDKHLDSQSPLLQHSTPESAVVGIIYLAQGPLLVAARPILTSEYVGPIRGTLIVGRYLDDGQIRNLARLTHLSVAAYPAEATLVPAEARRALSRLSDRQSFFVQPLSAKFIAGYTLLQDVYGRPSLLLRIEQPRLVYQQGQVSVRYLWILLLIVGIAFSAASLVLLERLVLSRLARLGAEVSRVGASGLATGRVTDMGHDELANLANAINQMLETLEHSQLELGESEARHRLLLASIRFPILALQQDMTILYCNDAYAAWAGKSTAELSGHNLLQSYPAFQDTRLYRACLSVLESGLLQQTEDEITGRTFHARVYPAPWGILVTAEDVTDYRRVERQARSLNAELEERVYERTAQLEAKNRELETFAYSVAHDLKAPLRGIDGYSRLLLIDYADRLDEDGRNFLLAIRNGTVRMGDLIDDLLAYARLERRQVELERVDLRALVESIFSEHVDELRERQIELLVNLRCDLVSADPEGLAQALRNLVDNAFKFTRDVAAPVIEIDARQVGLYCVLSVRDNGIGFDMQYHDLIFDIFQRLNRAEQYPGTGIGLALVRKAMQRMGGRVWAESAVGQGATFHLELALPAANVPP